MILLSSYRATETSEKREPNSETRKNPEKKCSHVQCFASLLPGLPVYYLIDRN